MKNSSNINSDLSPDFRKRLLSESRNPFRALRRTLWIAFFGSACIGLFVMALRLFSGNNLLLEDASVQIGATFLFGFLLWFDRNKRSSN